MGVAIVCALESVKSQDYVFIYLIMSMFRGQIDAVVGFAETKTLSRPVIPGSIWQKYVTTQLLYSLIPKLCQFYRCKSSRVIPPVARMPQPLSNPSWGPRLGATSETRSLCHFRFRHCLTSTRFYGNFQLRKSTKTIICHNVTINRIFWLFPW